MKFLEPLVLAVLLLGSAASTEACCYPRTNLRACFANQKTVAGAVEMYNLDFNLSLTSIPWDDLRRAGYLQSIPTDPGQGPDSHRNYVLTQEDVVCLVHGAIQGTGSPRQDLILRGVTDREVLGRALNRAESNPSSPQRLGDPGFAPGAGALAVVVAVSPLHAFFLTGLPRALR